MESINQPASSPAVAEANSVIEPAPSINGEEMDEEGIVFNARRITQAVVVFAAVICFGVFWIAGDFVGFPSESGHSGSVLFQSGGVLKLGMFWIALVLCTALASTIASWRWYLAGLFAACLGMSAWAIRGGSLRYVLFSASSPSVFLVLAVEQVMLVGGVAAMWLVLWRLQEVQQQLAPAVEETSGEEPPAGDPVFAIATQTLSMGIIVLLLTATDSLKQVSCTVFIAAACGTAIAQSMQKGAKNLGRWYWAGPMIVGLIGYLGCFIYPHGWDLGQPAGTFAALARPLPICYASLGIAGALFGLWLTETVIHVMVYSKMFATVHHGLVSPRQRKTPAPG